MSRDRRVADRMRPEERRQHVLLAATRLFGAYGYTAATTAAIGREAGISQAYVVRLFGSKEQLFAAVLRQAFATLLKAIRSRSGDPRRPNSGSDAADTSFQLPPIESAALTALIQAFVNPSTPMVQSIMQAGILQVYLTVRNQWDVTSAMANAYLGRLLLEGALLLLEFPK